jgi:hypothetical protein
MGNIVSPWNASARGPWTEVDVSFVCWLSITMGRHGRSAHDLSTNDRQEDNIL